MIPGAVSLYHSFYRSSDEIPTYFVGISASATPGPNAPLSNSCNNSTQPSANAHTGIQSWLAAGFPPSQIVLGVPAYGYISRSTASSLRNRRRSESYTVAKNEDGGTDGGQLQFKELVNQGILQRLSSSTSSMSDGDNVQYALSLSPLEIKLSPVSISNLALDDGSVSGFEGLNGFTRYWDKCSSTPFLKSEQAGQIITYDDPESLELKGNWAKQVGILGVNMFDIHGDTNQWDLVDGLRRGLALI
jgi:chitinase